MTLFIDDVLRTSLRTEKDEISVGAQLDPIGEKVKVHNKLSLQKCVVNSQKRLIYYLFVTVVLLHIQRAYICKE